MLLEEWRKRLDNNKTVGKTLINPSKAFDCILHDLLIAKLAADGIDNLILYMRSYLLNRTQFVPINELIMMNRFYGMVDPQTARSRIFGRDHRQEASPS